jgi:hypothetical protein
MAVILVVEDDFLISLSAQILLEGLGHNPLIANDLATDQVERQLYWASQQYEYHTFNSCCFSVALCHSFYT